MIAALYRIRLLFLRECYRVRKTLFSSVFHYAVLWPTFFALSTGYFSAASLFGESSAMKGTEMLLGVALLHVGLVAFIQTIPLLKERFVGKIVQYHISVTSLHEVFIARFLFALCFAFLLLAPYLPVAKLWLGDLFYTERVVWGHALLVQGVIMTFVVAYVFFWIGCLQSLSKIGSVWKRAMEPFLWLGGMWAPGYAVITAFPRLEWVIRLNPFFYATEAMRGVFLQTGQYTPLIQCCAVLLGYSAFFTCAAYILLRKRLEAV